MTVSTFSPVLLLMESGIALAAVVVRKRREGSRRFGIQRTSVIVTVATATVFCLKKEPSSTENRQIL